MFANITRALDQIKSDVTRALDRAWIVRICIELGHQWRERDTQHGNQRREVAIEGRRAGH